MCSSLDNDLFFLIAEMLRATFLDVAEAILQQRQTGRRFRVSVFSQNRMFDCLFEMVITGILDDRLYSLLRLAYSN
jgi:hypothetical protein